MLNCRSQAHRQPIKQPIGDVHLSRVAEPSLLIDLDSVRQDALEALAQAPAGIVVLYPNRQDDIHEFGWLQRRRIALAEGWEDVVLERRQPRLTHAASPRVPSQEGMDDDQVGNATSGLLESVRP
jgi:hypothetical protein